MKNEILNSYFFLLLLILISPFLSFCKKSETQFVTKDDTTAIPFYTALLNNDEFDDTIIIKPIEKFEDLSNLLKVNPWDTTEVSKYGEPLSLRIKFGNSNKEYLLHDSSFFASPMWDSDSLPFRILKKNQNEFIECKKNIPELNSDAIILGTEAGIDILLYWKGNEFKLFWPDEEP